MTDPTAAIVPEADAPMLHERAALFAIPATVQLRATTHPRRVDAWALALISKGIAPVVHWSDGAFELHVAEDDDVALAAAELDAFDAEEREAERAARAQVQPPPRSATKHATAGALLVSLVLLAFFAFTGPRAHGAGWFSAGASDAQRVLSGEWWRTVTALTLHADTAHVISNVGIGTFVVGAVMRSEGVGFGAALVLASGAAGNLLNAWAHRALHSSVGFSTAVFGAIGILGGIAYVHHRRGGGRPRPAWTALAGTAALLALLGASEKSNVDVLAHLFGAVAGVGLGALTAWRQWRPLSASRQWLWGLATIAAVCAAWSAALA